MMSFEKELDKYGFDDTKDFIYSRTAADVEFALGKDKLDEEDLAALLSPAAEAYLEPMAQQASDITLRRFGKTIKIYAPMYLSNVCSNSCKYCGFNRHNEIPRVILNDEEISKETEIVYNMGIRHMLLVTGEHPAQVGTDYLINAVNLMKDKFSSICIEVYPMSVEDYALMYNHGVDGLTMFQETYNRDTYADMHPAGKKRDFGWRLGGPERGAEAGFRSIGMGALMGLDDFRTDQFFLALHANYIMKNYWKTHVSVSFPRIRKASGNFKPHNIVDDISYVQMTLAHRLFQHDLGINISTRESADFRDNLLPLGVTQMSAGSKTEPGGYAKEHKGKQFEVEDKRSVEEFCNMLRSKGYDPVMKDWDISFLLGA
jgi:2-iminoacetate synthase